MPQSILVTGATGFVGSVVARELVRRGHTTYALVRKNSHHGFLKEAGVELIFGDLSDSVTAPQFPKLDGVIHLAGLIKARSTQEFYDVNVDGTDRLITQLKNTGYTRFVLVSSIAARGPNASEHDANGTVPVSHYGKSKLAAENRARSLIDSKSLVIIRPPSVYGPGDQATLTLFKFWKRGFFPAIGHRHTKISFIYVLDLAEILTHTALTPSAGPGPFYPDDGAGGHSGDDIRAAASAVFGRKIFSPLFPLWAVKTLAYVSEWGGRMAGIVPLFTREKFNELAQPFWFCSADSLRKEFQLPPPTPLAHGMAITKAWYENAGWL